jgi:hypothetical protein
MTTGFLDSDLHSQDTELQPIPQHELAPGIIDIRLRQLSYSSLNTLHSCPREYQLYRQQILRSVPESNTATAITFAYGHVVGLGLQLVLQHMPENELLWNLFLMWEPDLFAADDKANKDFWQAILAVYKFKAMRDARYLDGYELVQYDGKPAVELGFKILLPGDFIYRGSVDAVLQHTTTGKVIVLECKTTGSPSIHPAQYANSSQAIGYSIVLDFLFPELSSYDVLYEIYKTKQCEWEQMAFTKNYLQRALWIQELILDVKTIQMYEEAHVYPMRGSSCLRYFRECSYFNSCHLATDYLVAPLTPEIYYRVLAENERYSITVTLEELIHTQLAKEASGMLGVQQQALQASEPQQAGNPDVFLEDL